MKGLTCTAEQMAFKALFARDLLSFGVIGGVKHSFYVQIGK